MKIIFGEVCIETNDVIKVADFYRKILMIASDQKDYNDKVHQFIITEETTLTVYNDGTEKNNQNQNISLAFTVDDVDQEYNRLLNLGIQIIDAPKLQQLYNLNM